MGVVVITGVAGFLGSHLAFRHIERGDFVIGLDNFCSSSPDSDHIKQLKRNKSVAFYDVDICKRDQVYSAVDDALTRKGLSSDQGDIDIVMNFACPASPPRYQAIPVETMMTCVVGTKNMLDLARDLDCTIVHASTSEIYGDPDISPQVETYWGNVNTWGIRANYDNGKRSAETLCHDYIHKYNVDVRVVRIFNTYGDCMHPDDGRVISNFINQAIRKEFLTVYGAGDQSRSFCFVDDLIDGIVKFGALPSSLITERRPMNLGNPNEFTIFELAWMIHERFPGTKIIHKDIPMDDPKQRCPDITRAKTLLNWEPRIQLSEGLDRTIEYFKFLHDKNM
jgi:UDP-glucuronate decarboxylase